MTKDQLSSTRPMWSAAIAVVVALTARGCASNPRGAEPAEPDGGTVPDSGQRDANGPDVEVVPPHAEEISKSGTRLRRMLVSAGGSEAQFVGWRDAERNETCVFGATDDIDLYDLCIPQSRVRLGEQYADAACTQRVVASAATPVSCRPGFGIMSRTGPNTPSRVIELDVNAASGPLYVNGQPNCNLFNDGTPVQLQALKTEVPLGSFEERTPELVSIDRPSLTLFAREAGDGSREAAGYAIPGTFGVPPQPCTLGYWKDGSIRCVPEAAKVTASVFATSDCTGSRSFVTAASGLSVVADRTVTCTETWTAFGTLGQSTTSPTFARSSRCNPLPLGTDVYALSVEVSSPFPEVKLTTAVALGRLQARFLEVDGMRSLLDWQDTQRGGTCRFVPTADGTYRCLPSHSMRPSLPPVFSLAPAPNLDSSFGRTLHRFRDPTCTQAVEVLEQSQTTCTTLPKEVTGVDEGCPDSYRGYRVKGAITGLYYRLFSFGPCRPTNATSLFELEEIPSSEFAEGTLTIE